MLSRSAALLLAVCVLDQATGCASGAQKAHEAWSQLAPGMTRDEVRHRIGSPLKSYQVDPVPGVPAQTVEVWLYSYSGTEITAAEFAAGVILLAAAFAVAAASIKGGGGGGWGGGWGGGGGGGDPDTYRFFIGFGADGRVREVTMIEPAQR
jgi:hypothetical protein